MNGNTIESWPQIWKLETIQMKPLQQNFDTMLFNYKDFTKMKFRIFVSFLFLFATNRVFSHDVTAAILVFQNNKTEAMLVFKTNPVGIVFLLLLPTHPSPKPTFCPKWKVRVNVGLGEG